MMKNNFLKTIFFLVMISSVISCKKYLDINTDPDTTQEPDPSSVLPAMLAGIPRGNQYDARYLALYTGNFFGHKTPVTAAEIARFNWESYGYQPGSDNGGDVWRQTYYGLGANLDYMIGKAITLEKWDYVGVATALKAYQFLQSSDQNGPIIFHEFYKPNTLYFNFEDQEIVYPGIDSLCRVALTYLERTDGKVSSASLAKGDYSYNGDRLKWIKFVYGLLARVYSHQTNKPQFVSQYADSVIKFADLSFTSGADDFLIPFDATKNDDANFLGTYRDNMTTYRQSNFIVKLLDGTTFTGVSNGTTRDPRLAQMLSASQDTTNGNGGYRGLDPTSGGDPFFGVTTGANARKRIATPFGDSTYVNPSASSFSSTNGKYLFRDKAVMPVITYSEIQFMKSEAAFKKSDFATAHVAYLNGIQAHFAFINRTSYPRSNVALFTGASIPASRIASYMTGPNVKQTPATLTLSDIMLQKYIALWGWGFLETWTDMRKYHYITDLDAATGLPVYRNYVMPTTYYINNLGTNPAYRLRPRFNSEYVWNQAALEPFGGLAIDYHTKETWVTKP